MGYHLPPYRPPGPRARQSQAGAQPDAAKVQGEKKRFSAGRLAYAAGSKIHPDESAHPVVSCTGY